MSQVQMEVPLPLKKLNKKIFGEAVRAVKRNFGVTEDSFLETPVLIVGCKEGSATYVEFSNMHQVEAPSMKQGFADSIETGSYDLIYIIDFMKSADNSGRFWSGSNRPTEAKGNELYYEDCEIIKVFSKEEF